MTHGAELREQHPGADHYTLQQLATLLPWQRRLAALLLDHLGWVPTTDYTFEQDAGEWQVVCPHYPANGPDATNAYEVLAAYTDTVEDPMPLEPAPHEAGFHITLVEV